MTSKVILLAVGLMSVFLAGCTDDSDDDESGAALLAQLSALYVDKPFMGGQETPGHTFLMEDATNFQFLHWNNDDVSKATGLAFVGDAFRAKGCIGNGGVSQAQVDAGYVHFHKESIANWDQGHHTDPQNPNLAGYWFRHIAAAPGVDPMGIGASQPGEVYNLMPSAETAPACPLL